ncbi:hypothetical protein U4L59_21135 [Klebsiella pneumoniae]|uniref:hypothetical protein n=1 Tax=Klebsiella pneumoniae TaxID=573 RepID=UPI0027F7DAB9|nr:hypothetical protein [Klebsiella pneumoniae]ELA1908793.1 hypothetical protein [Klebsiella pneumoniae]MDZ6093677.1 hypothetical protein [Klebsiella pneumoniae]
MTDITELARRVEHIISDMKLKHGDKDTYAPVMKWDEFLALVEALEKAQAATTQQGNIASALLDEVTQLRRHADEKAPELRALLIEADSELEVLRQRIAGLESRTVKLTDINEYLAEVHDKTLNRAFRLLAEGVRAGDVAAMRAAGIKVEAE